MTRSRYSSYVTQSASWDGRIRNWEMSIGSWRRSRSKWGNRLKEWRVRKICHRWTTLLPSMISGCLSSNDLNKRIKWINYPSKLHLNLKITNLSPTLPESLLFPTATTRAVSSVQADGAQTPFLTQERRKSSMVMTRNPSILTNSRETPSLSVLAHSRLEPRACCVREQLISVRQREPLECAIFWKIQQWREWLTHG